MPVNRCPHALVAAKVGIILGMLQRLHYDLRPSVEPSIPSGEGLPRWLEFLPLPCRCEVCSAVAERSLVTGYRHRIRTEDIPKLTAYSRSLIIDSVNSKLNQAIVTALPHLTKYLDTARVKL